MGNPLLIIRGIIKNQISRIRSLSWGYDFNHESEYTRALVDSVAGFWMSEYKIDGFR